MGKGKAKGWRPPRDGAGNSGLLFGSADHLTGDTIASPVQLREEGRSLPANHLNYADHDSKGKWKGKGDGKADSKGGAGAGKGDSKDTSDDRPVKGVMVPPPKEVVKKEAPPVVKKETPVKQEVKEEVKDEQAAAKAQRFIEAKTEIERRREAMLAREKAAQLAGPLVTDDAEARRRAVESRRREAEHTAREAENRRRQALATAAAEKTESLIRPKEEDAEAGAGKRKQDGEDGPDAKRPRTGDAAPSTYKLGGGGFFANRTVSSSSTSPAPAPSATSASTYKLGGGGFFANRKAAATAPAPSAPSVEQAKETDGEPALEPAVSGLEGTATSSVKEEAEPAEFEEHQTSAQQDGAAQSAADGSQPSPIATATASSTPAVRPAAEPAENADAKASQAAKPAAGGGRGAAGLQSWAARVNAMADAGDPDMVKRCREFVRQRILKAHATGDLHTNEWDEEPMPTLEHLCGGG